MRSFSALAPRQLRARRLRALLTAAGIVLGVAMILGVLLLSATIQRTFADLFDSVYGRADLVVSGSQSSGTLDISTLDKVRRTEGVEQAVGNIQARFNLIEDKPKPPPEPPTTLPEGTPAPAGAAKPEVEVTGEPLNGAGQDPAAADFSDTETVAGHDPRHGRQIALQESWADANKLEVGDHARLATPSGVKRLEVVGLFKFTTGLDFGGEGFATMPLGAARELMDKPHGYDEIQLTVGGGEDTIESVRRRLEHELERGAKVETPDAKAGEVESQLQAFNVILYFFAAMALFVGAFLIFNSFNMTVLQRIREIGMLRTLGATRRMIVRSVLIEAALLGLLGTVLGIALGVALAVGGLKIGPLALSSSSIWIPILIIGFVYTPYMARPIRGEVLALREKEFVESAVAQGAGSLRIMFTELLPNLWSTIIVFFTLNIANNLLLESALSFLGAGVQPPESSWGSMIAKGNELLYSAPWLTIAPGLMILLTVLSLNVLGDCLRDALDPKSKVRLEVEAHAGTYEPETGRV